MGARSGELVATDKPAVVPETLLDAVVVEDSQGNRCLPNPPWADESDWSEVFREANNLLDQLIASATSPWRWGRKFTTYAR